MVTLWCLAGFTLLRQAQLIREHFGVVSQLGLRGAPAANTPLRQAFPAFAADAQVWIRHAIALREGDDVRLRQTTIDNAPNGREVHWNSAWAWTIAGAGWIHQLFTGEPMTSAVEKATFWLAPSILLALIILLSTWATRRAGLIAGVLVIVAMTAHDRIFEGFFPSYVDHHGLLTVSVLGMIMGAVFMGGGWWQERRLGTLAMLPRSPEIARTAAMFSAFSGACGLWVSAASAIPPIAIVGCAGVLAIVAQGRAALAQGVTFDPTTWRIWGRTGFAVSLFFYLLEYFPNHLSMRLEPNHPLHDLAWLGAGELIAEFGQRWLGAKEDRWKRLQQLVLPLIGVALAPAAILIGGTRVLSFIDPFMSRLHSGYIQEFLPLWVTIRTFDSKTVFQLLGVGSAPLIAAIATLSYRRRDTPIVLWFVAFATFFFTVMAWWQSRWLLNATGAQICCLLVVLATWTQPLSAPLRWAAALAAAGFLFLPNAYLRYTTSVNQLKLRHVAPTDANGMFLRDIARLIRASQPEGDITLLTSPNASTGIGYYGRFKTLGTLYWENTEGLKSAAGILAAKSEAEAAKLIKERKVTHIVVIIEENFIAPYFQLLNRNGTQEEFAKSFGYRLLADKVVPQWLQMLPYKIPDDLASLKMSAMLFKVNFNQTLPEALYHVAQAQIASGATIEAERTLDILISQVPQICEPWLRKAEILLNRHMWAESAQHFLKGISLAPEADRPTLYATAASLFYNNKQHATAIHIYRAALAQKPVPELVSYLAWVLATTTDDTLRNGKESLELAQVAIAADPTSPNYLTSLAAALGENGRFADAVIAADRAVANSRVRNDPPATQETFQQRLAILKSGKPIRN